MRQVRLARIARTFSNLMTTATSTGIKSAGTVKDTLQELSYRKQIARQLRTQCIEGIYRPNYPVTSKSKLRVTQGY